MLSSLSTVRMQLKAGKNQSVTLMKNIFGSSSTEVFVCITWSNCLNISFSSSSFVAENSKYHRSLFHALIALCISVHACFAESLRHVYVPVPKFRTWTVSAQLMNRFFMRIANDVILSLYPSLGVRQIKMDAMSRLWWVFLIYRHYH